MSRGLSPGHGSIGRFRAAYPWLVKVFLPDGKELELEDDATGLDAARAIGPKLAEQAVPLRSHRHVQDLRPPLADGAPIQLLAIRDKDDPDAPHVLRHSRAPTGAATSTTSSSPASTAPPSTRRRTSTRTSRGSRKPANATTAGSASSSTSSTSTRSRPARRSGTRRGW